MQGVKLMPISDNLNDLWSMIHSSAWIFLLIAAILVTLMLPSIAEIGRINSRQRQRKLKNKVKDQYHE